MKRRKEWKGLNGMGCDGREDRAGNRRKEIDRRSGERAKSNVWRSVPNSSMLASPMRGKNLPLDCYFDKTFNFWHPMPPPSHACER